MTALLHGEETRGSSGAFRPRQLIRPSSRDGLTTDFHWRQILPNVACSIGSAVRPCMSATSARLARDIERPHRVDKSPFQRSRLDRLGFIYIELVFCTSPQRHVSKKPPIRSADVTGGPLEWELRSQLFQ